MPGPEGRPYYVTPEKATQWEPPPGIEWRFLSNLAYRPFEAKVSTPDIAVSATFTSVEGLYQGLKFNLSTKVSLIQPQYAAQPKHENTRQ